MCRYLWTSTLSILLASHSYAAMDMTSCTDIAKLPAQQPTQFMLIAVDQTTVPDANLTNKFVSLAVETIKPDTEVSTYTFSSFSQGRYLSEGFTAALDAQLDDKVRYETAKKTLAVFDRCLAQKAPAMKQQLQTHLQQAMQQASGQLAKSDVIQSLVELAKVIKSNPATRKQAFVFSDMLENSSVTSFYSNNSVKKLDAAKELALVEKANMFADFGGAKIYVMGAGLLSEQGKSKGVYRDPKTLQALQAFWIEWFKRSNAELVEFGMPEMLGEIK
ncbi:MAG: hypothetical protein JHC38_03425 [Thiotrichales bacterium]|jgi:hypothetical protein|nr:hypothetical protein [Thiotrichales bacterium]